MTSKQHIMGTVFRKAIGNMFDLIQDNLSSKLRLLPGCIQRRGSSIYYTDKFFLANRIPESFKYKFEDEENVYNVARKRTTTADSEKILF
jgi:hypothetical protein